MAGTNPRLLPEQIKSHHPCVQPLFPYSVLCRKTNGLQLVGTSEIHDSACVSERCIRVNMCKCAHRPNVISDPLRAISSQIHHHLGNVGEGKGS